MKKHEISSFILKAKEIARKLGFEIESHPESKHSIWIVFYINDYFLDMDINDECEVSLTYERGITMNFKPIWKKNNVTIDDVENALEEIKRDSIKEIIP